MKTTSNFYYYDDTPGAYGTGLHYYYLVPNYNCAPYRIEETAGNGTITSHTTDASCFMVNWTNPSVTGLSAMELLNYDINWGTGQRPAIMKIAFTNLKDGSDHPSHFVVIGGYDTSCGSDDGCYRAHNPMFRDNERNNKPNALNGETQYGEKDKDGNPRYHFDRMVTLYRFTDKYNSDPLDTSNVAITAHSPVEMQVIDPDGNMIGYDPETGERYLENPMSLYYEDTPVTALDGSDSPSEPVKKLNIIQPKQGNYIFKIFGTGDGPYTIDVELTKSDGTPNLVTQFTGTATPSLSETYRITYSPTGDASLSQTNLAPVANAGANQTGEQSYDITLDGSASSDPDGDPPYHPTGVFSGYIA